MRIDPLEEAKRTTVTAVPVAPVLSSKSKPLPADRITLPEKVRVLRDARVSFGNQTTTIPAGSIVSEALYGPGALQALKTFRVETEPVKE